MDILMDIMTSFLEANINKSLDTKVSSLSLLKNAMHIGFTPKSKLTRILQISQNKHTTIIVTRFILKRDF